MLDVEQVVHEVGERQGLRGFVSLVAPVSLTQGQRTGQVAPLMILSKDRTSGMPDVMPDLPDRSDDFSLMDD